MRQSALFALLLLAASAAGAELQITRFARDGSMAITNTSTNSVCTLQRAGVVTGPYVPGWQVFSSQSEIESQVAPFGFYRACAVEITPDAPGFTNLLQSYSALSTVAGAGGATGSGVNKWRSSFEGGPATSALLSRPHIAMADRSGNILIAEHDAGYIRKVRFLRYQP